VARPLGERGAVRALRFAGNDDGTTSVYSLRRSNGTLHEIDGSPFQTGGLQPELAFASAH
jgi:hypothetical protein